MIRLNLPSRSFRIKSKENKHYIFDRIRKKDVLLTDEEWVRQHFVEYLIIDKNYPQGRIAVEKQCKVENTIKRTDIVVYSKNGDSEIIVECKAPQVKITQETFDQIARYNLKLKAKYLIVTNGLNHYYCQVDHDKKKYNFLPEIPMFNQI